METSEIIIIAAPLVILQTGLQIYALYDIYKRGGTRPPLSDLAWVLIIVLGQLIGPLVYFFLGRREDV